MTDYSRRSEWPLQGECDSCGNDGMVLTKKDGEYLCDYCYEQIEDEDEAVKVASSHDDFIDFFRDTFGSTTTGKAE